MYSVQNKECTNRDATVKTDLTTHLVLVQYYMLHKSNNFPLGVFISYFLHQQNFPEERMLDHEYLWSQTDSLSLDTKPVHST